MNFMERLRAVSESRGLDISSGTQVEPLVNKMKDFGGDVEDVIIDTDEVIDTSEVIEEPVHSDEGNNLSEQNKEEPMTVVNQDSQSVSPSESTNRSFLEQVNIKLAKQFRVGESKLTELERETFMRYVSGTEIGKVNVITLEGDPSLQLKPETVRDSGRISTIIEDYQKDTGLRIIPASITNIPDFVVPSRHSYFTDRGERHYYSNSDRVIDRLRDEFLQTLSTGEYVSYSISKVVPYNGADTYVYTLTPEEVKSLALMFNAYGSKIVEVEQSKFKLLKLVIGDYIA